MRTLRVVSVNDVYILSNLPRLANLARQHRSGADAFLFVLAGDFLSPSLLSSIDAGRGMVDCLNAVGITHVVLGNHEDDLPLVELQARLAELHATCIGTNVGLDLPRSVVIDVAGEKVGLVGTVMADASVYRATPFEGVVPANPAALAETSKLLETCRTVIAITHQSVADDRALALAHPYPLIVGGHDHVPTLVQQGKTWIVKAGSEAVNAVISDVRIDDGGEVTVTTRLEPVAGYPEDAELRARVDRHMEHVRELAAATLYHVEGPPLSSVGTRARQTSLGTLLCSRLRDCLGAEACIFNGGGIRASREYPERLTFGDVEAEVPFDNEVVVVAMPGAVLRDAVAASRAHAPAESGAFLQVDDRMTVEGATLTGVNGEPLDPEREYLVAVVREMLLGLDRIEPLVRWASEHRDRLPESGSGREPKLLLVQAFAHAIWQKLGRFEDVDLDHDERITVSEIAAGIARVHPQDPPSPMLADIVLHAIDADADQVISREDAARALRPAR